jgi:hypothetical protein
VHHVGVFRLWTEKEIHAVMVVYDDFDFSLAWFRLGMKKIYRNVAPSFVFDNYYPIMA